MLKTTSLGLALASMVGVTLLSVPVTANAETIFGSAMIEPTPWGANFYASWSRNSQEQADQMARNQCGSAAGGGAVCDHYVRWTNGCAVVASRGAGYFYGIGANSGDASRIALNAANAGPSATGSAIPNPAMPVATFCTPGAK